MESLKGQTLFMFFLSHLLFFIYLFIRTEFEKWYLIKLRYFVGPFHLTPIAIVKKLYLFYVYLFDPI